MQNFRRLSVVDILVALNFKAENGLFVHCLGPTSVSTPPVFLV